MRLSVEVEIVSMISTVYEKILLVEKPKKDMENIIGPSEIDFINFIFWPIFIFHSFDLRSPCDTALTLASEYGSKETVEYLITELKVDVRETGHQERNCFLNAALGGKIETLEYLYSYGALIRGL